MAELASGRELIYFQTSHSSSYKVYRALEFFFSFCVLKSEF